MTAARRRAPLALAAALLCGCVAAAEQPAATAPLAADGAHDAALRAYVYGFAPVLLDVVRERALGAPGGEVNRLRNAYALLTAANRTVVAPNQDTLYSTAFLDLAAEPIVLSLPPSGGRYHVFPLLDAYTNVFASLGSRTTGDGGGDFAICGPGFTGALPAGVTRVDSPTRDVWLLGRTVVKGADDVPAAAALVRRYALTPLARWAAGERLAGLARTPAAPASGGGAARAPPLDELLAWDAPTFYARLAALLRRNPPPTDEAPRLPEAAPAEAERAAHAGLARIRAHLPVAFPRVNGWAWAATGIGAYGDDALQRAAVALVGLGANLPEDTVYARAEHDAEGRRLVGAHAYELRFAAGAEPPVDAFWSLTLYGPDDHFVPNPLGRHVLGDRDPLVREADGSLVLRIQHAPPADAAHAANWLPAPAGELVLVLRLYRPREAVRDGTWKPPRIERLATR